MNPHSLARDLNIRKSNQTVLSKTSRQVLNGGFTLKSPEALLNNTGTQPWSLELVFFCFCFLNSLDDSLKARVENHCSAVSCVGMCVFGERIQKESLWPIGSSKGWMWGPTLRKTYCSPFQSHLRTCHFWASQAFSLFSQPLVFSNLFASFPSFFLLHLLFQDLLFLVSSLSWKLWLLF